ncbi:MAG: aminotransferase class I/II-fold pyridoxal phosphate-dependent enzyme, partial [Bdellovibrionales bacterium]|nr:aminotransferase class I/II-fold pyridoxal phosphate-dependent enzyme [Bdellovibrionales bacterium]
MSNALAIFGGTPVTTKNFLVYNTIGDDEKRAVMEVLDSGNLSCFVANGSDAFYGGPKVRQLERAWAQFFGVKHAVSMNSATSGLYAAVAACSIGPGDEVILSPLTMCATGTAILLNGATPVFCDVDPLTMNMDPNRIEDCVTSKTKAIFVVHLGGHPCDMDPIIGIARKYQLRVLGD